jgi:hypothetical protein
MCQIWRNSAGADLLNQALRFGTTHALNKASLLYAVRVLDPLASLIPLPHRSAGPKKGPASLAEMDWTSRSDGCNPRPVVLTDDALSASCCPNRRRRCRERRVRSLERVQTPAHVWRSYRRRIGTLLSFGRFYRNAAAPQLRRSRSPSPHRLGRVRIGWDECA